MALQSKLKPGDYVKLFLIAMLPLLLPYSSFAEENSSESTASTSSGEINAGPKEKLTDEADELITNRRFRADQGSLSPWSFRSVWSYNGGSLERPFAADRPNINSDSTVAALQNLSGTVGISYRLTKKDRMGLNLGLSMDSPFHSSIDESVSARTKRQFDENQGDLQASNPSLSYSRIEKLLGIQTIFGASFTKYTAGNRTDIGFDYELAATMNTMYDIGKTGLSVGAYFGFFRNFFNDDNPEFLREQGETTVGFYPQIEYVIDDTFNLRTVFRAAIYQNTREFTTLRKQILSQSVGLGISLTRDIFLYPNIQFIPEDISLDRTNVGLTANLNLF